MPDHLEKNPDGTPKDNSQNYTAEFVEDLKQKQANTSSENTVLQEVIKVQDSEDNKYLLDLHESNPAMAGRVSKHMGYELDDALAAVQSALDGKNPPDPKNNDNPLNEDEIIDKAIGKMKGEEVKKFEKEFFDELPENTRDEVRKTYKKISGTGSKTVDQAKEFLDMAQTYVNKDNKTPKPADVIPRSSLSLGLNNGSVTKPSTTIDPNTQKLADELGIKL